LARRPPALIQLRLTGWKLIGMPVSTVIPMLPNMIPPASKGAVGIIRTRRRVLGFSWLSSLLYDWD
jgi:hypothetical protein